MFAQRCTIPFCLSHLHTAVVDRAGWWKLEHHGRRDEQDHRMAMASDATAGQQSNATVAQQRCVSHTGFGRGVAAEGPHRRLYRLALVPECCSKPGAELRRQGLAILLEVVVDDSLCLEALEILQHGR